jgi:DeoR-like helix-turn-helix domain
MLENGKNDFISKKSYEISYALWRIMANIAEKSLSAKIAGKSIDLIGYVAEGDFERLAANLPGVELLIRFAVDVNAISVQNAEIMTKEIGNLKSAILEFNTANSIDNMLISGKENDIDISDIFSATSNFEEKEMPETWVDIPEIKPAKQSGNETIMVSMKAEARQSAILDRVRQIGNCRLNDIQAILPETSERTIRYDLEAMVQKKIIERVGTGGRSVHYKIPDKIPDSN